MVQIIGLISSLDSTGSTATVNTFLWQRPIAAPVSFIFHKNEDPTGIVLT